MSTGRLAGRVSLVFGGGSEEGTAGEAACDGAVSIGRAIALRLASDGSDVAVADLVRERAQATVDAFGGGGLALASDATDPEQCKAVVAEVLAHYGRLDVVVANVGIHGRQAIREQSVEDWDLTFAVNTRSHYLVAQAALPHMLNQGSGAFVFVSSTSALRSSGTGLAYEASKAAQLAVARHIAVRYCGRGIRSNSLVLGAMDTPMANRLFGDDPSQIEFRDGLTPMGRQGQAQEAAAAAAFLASDDASYTTGAEILVDGGLTATSFAYRPRPVRA